MVGENGAMPLTTLAPPAPTAGADTATDRAVTRVGPGRAAAAAVSVVVLCALPVGDLGASARLALAVLGLAVVGWTLTSIVDTWVALGAAGAVVLTGAASPADAAAAVFDPTVALLLAAFVLAAGVGASGLADRLTLGLASRARSVRRLFVVVSAALGLTSFVIPATSGRAALALPMFLALAAAIDDRRVVRALSLLFPTIILLSAVASLLGAGAHLVTAEVLEAMTGTRISFARWILLGLPFAAASCAASCWVVLHLFLTAEERGRPLDLRAALAGTTSAERRRCQRAVGIVVAVAVALWATEPVHGLAPAVVAVGAGMTVVGRRCLPARQAWRSIKWELLAFLIASLVLGDALVASGGAGWVMDIGFGWIGRTTPAWVVFGAVAGVSLAAHLVITSRTVRATVLIPLVILVAQASGLDPATAVFVSTAGAGYCLTLPVSAKPVALFAKAGIPSYDARDLARLSAVLLPLHLVLLLVFALAVWPAAGLDAGRGDTVASAPGALDMGSGLAAGSTSATPATPAPLATLPVVASALSDVTAAAPTAPTVPTAPVRAPAPAVGQHHSDNNTDTDTDDDDPDDDD